MDFLENSHLMALARFGLDVFLSRRHPFVTAAKDGGDDGGEVNFYPRYRSFYIVRRSRITDRGLLEARCLCNFRASACGATATSL